jgi:hypothetical protein
MPPRNLVRAFVFLWWATGAMLAYGSVRTVIDALSSAHHRDPHVALLGAVEGVSALLFVIPRTLRAGAAGLLGTIAIAFVLHASLGQFRGDLVLYAACVTFVLVHGPLTTAQWRHAISRRPA